MNLKDYYDILEIDTTATIPEIKKSFRKLAQQFHPDKTQSNPYASAQFNEINEAYQVLTDPSKKEYYLQQRWYNQSIARRKKQDVITPVTILKQSLELEKYVSTLDEYRMDKQGLEDYLLALLSNERVDLLKQFKEPDIIYQIVKLVLRTINSLPYKYATSIIIQLQSLAENDEPLKHQISISINKAAKKDLWEKYSTLFLFLLSLLVCTIIYLAAR